MTTRKISTIGLISSDKTAFDTAIDLGSGFTIGRWQMVSDNLAADVIVLDNQDKETIKTVSDMIKTTAEKDRPLVIEYYNDESMLEIAKAAGGLYLISPLAYNNVISFLKTLEVELKKPADQRFQANILTTAETAPEAQSEAKPAEIADIAEPVVESISEEPTESVPEIIDDSTFEAPEVEIPVVEAIVEDPVEESLPDLTIDDSLEITEVEEPVVESISEEPTEESLPELSIEDSLEISEVEEPDVETKKEEQKSGHSLPDLTLHSSDEGNSAKPEGKSFADLIMQQGSMEETLSDQDDSEGAIKEVENDSYNKSIREEIVLETPVYEIPSNKPDKDEKETESSADQGESVIENLDEYADTVESSIERKNIDWLSDDSIDSETESEPAEASATSKPEEKKSDTASVSELDLDMISDDEYEDLGAAIPLTDIKDIPTDEGEFDPDTQLIGLIQKIIGQGKTAQITHKDYPLIRIFPDNGWFVFAEELDSYPSMYRDDASSFSIESAEEEIKDELFNGRLPQSLWKLIFTAALFGSDGRLFEHLHHSEKFQLMHPPYFGMVPHTAEHIAIAEHMVNNAGTIDTIAEDLDIDIHTVIDFCNACDAIKLLHRDSKTTEGGDGNIMQVDITEIEETPTVESETETPEKEQEQTQSETKPGLINSLWSSLTK